MITCDSITGTCAISEEKNATSKMEHSPSPTTIVRYVGDPMCSWCWGISPVLKEINEFCKQQGFMFEITVGGLRAGGGDPWTPSFKEFLSTEWQHISRVTGQPFGYSLLSKPQFDYDTEPACRAVVSSQILIEKNLVPVDISLDFFSAIQRKFYVEGQDPKELGFYKDICEATEVPVELFMKIFNSDEAYKKTNQEFSRCRRLGVRAFPTLLLEKKDENIVLGTGYVSATEIIEKIKKSTEN